MLPRSLAALCLLLVLPACPKHVDATAIKQRPPQSFRVLTATAERETLQIPDKRTDIEVDTRDQERTPRVVATGETPVFKLDGGRARLFGDAAGSTGFEVDNFILFDVLNASGQLLGRFAVGFAPEGVDIGSERVDNQGRMSFVFEPGEIDITSRLPESEPFKLRATALDYGGVGRVSDVFVMVDSAVHVPSDNEDLRTQ